MYISQTTPEEVCWTIVITLLHTFSQCRCIYPTGTSRNHCYHTKEQLIPKQPSTETRSYFFVIAACTGTGFDFIKINGKDPTDLGGLWIRSTRAGLDPIANFFSIMIMKFCSSKTSVSLSTSILASEYSVHPLQQCAFLIWAFFRFSYLLSTADGAGYHS